jgi:DNA-binding CsgD family transcriptional regulator
MEPLDWNDPGSVLVAAVGVLSGPIEDSLIRLSQALASLVPHTAMAQLSDVCAYSPLQVAGEEALTRKITSRELSQLAGTVDLAQPWQGQAVLAGTSRFLVAVASAPTGHAGGLLVIVVANDQPVQPRTLALVQAMWDLLTIRSISYAADAAPLSVAVSRAAARARARAVAELSDSHSSVLAALLNTLRTARLDDTAARRNALDLAVSAMIKLRSGTELDRELSEEPADASFARLTDELLPLVRYSPVQLDLSAPGLDVTLPSAVAYLARAAARASVQAMLDQDGVNRIHVAWRVENETLRVTVRDDGGGKMEPDAPALHRISERLPMLSGNLRVDATPGWGTIITVTLPLYAAEPSTERSRLLDGLQQRELDVLTLLAGGRRNRSIAEELYLSESAVKYHVANILKKLGATTRGEAAALAHHAGLAASDHEIHPTRSDRD